MKTMTRLDRVASVQARIGWKALTAAEYQDEGYAFLATPNIKPPSIDFEDVNYISHARYEESPELKIQLGDVLLAKDGSTLGIANCVRSLPRPATVNGSIAVLRPRGVEPRFLTYWLQGSVIQGRIAEVKDGMGVPHLFQADIKKFPVPELAVVKQRRIADFLDDRVDRIDRIIAARRRQLASARQNLDAEWSERSASLEQRDGLVPMRRFLVSIVDGPFGSSLASAHYTDVGTRVIRLGNIGIAEFSDVDQAFVSMEYGETLSAHSATKGDLIMAGLGDDRMPLGRCAVVPESIGPAIVKADCYRIRLDYRVRHQFAALFLSSPPARRRTALLGRGATRLRLNTEVARGAELPPSRDAEQVSYAAFVRSGQETVRSAESALTRSIELVTEYKTSLITAAVTGEIDVTTAGSGVPG